MKLLKKLRLINWHYFANITVDFDRINFLTGENAAGKSTLIDALQVVLLGDTSGRIFNKAASEKSGRTLKGYLKGEIGDEGEGVYRYIRNGRFTSYIALEFFDDVINVPFTLGIVFDVFEDSSETHRFFLLKDKFPHGDFCSLGVPLDHKGLAMFFAQNYASNEYKFFDTNAQYQLMLKEQFGNIKDKYFSLLKKAVSFSPITNIEQFITEYVCDVPSEINISSMRENIKQYKRLEIEASTMQEKIQRLELISKAYNDVLTRKQELALSSYISKRVSYQVYLDTIRNLQHEIASNELRLKENDEKINDIDEEIKAFQEKKEALIAQKVSSSSYQMNKDLKNAIEKAKDNIRRIEDDLSSDHQKLSSYIHNFLNDSRVLKEGIKALEEDAEYKDNISLKDLNLKANNLDKIGNDFMKKLASRENLNSADLENFKNASIDFKNGASEHYGYFKNILAVNLTRLSQDNNRLNDNSSNGGKMYDYNLTLIRFQLKHALEDYFNESVEVSFYSDLIDIKNPLWTNAIEGFIYSQKVNMFVEEKYYKVANDILPSIMKKNNYFRTGLVDSERLKKAHFDVYDNSLAEEIITDHEGAKAYSNFLLGKMNKCDTFEEARISGHGLTPSCIGYRNFSSFVLPTSHYQYPLIGRKISLKQKEERIKELKRKENLLHILEQFVDILGRISREEIMNKNETDLFIKHLDDFALLPSLKENLNKYEKDLELGSSQEIALLEERILHIEKDLEALSNERQDLLVTKGKISASSQAINEEKIPTQLKLASSLQEEIKNEFSEEFISEIGLPTFNEELNHGKTLGEIRLEYDELYTKGQYYLRSALAKLNELRKDYIVDYKLSYDITRTDNDDFDNDLYNLKEVRLPSYRKKIEDAHEKAIKEFKDDFIFKLKTSIESARTQIDELNEALKDAQFGADSYQFTVVPAPQYKEYYDMITDDLLLNFGQDENIYLEKYKDIMNNLFKLIGETSSSKDQDAIIAQNVEKFTDYRTYLLFDLVVSHEGRKAYSLARNIKKASGGETQTPFYISILASFSQLYRVNGPKNMSNTLRLVIFDEAFSKMDRNRIVESIRILKSFGLQVILSAPPEKVSDISKLVDRTLLVSRGKNRSYVESFSQIKAN